MTQEKFLSILGWVATATAMAMYISYIPQISSNLSGHKGDWLQPMVAGINCVLWVGYGFIRKKKDWPIVIANFPGVVCGLFHGFIKAHHQLNNERTTKQQTNILTG